jgi:hypothetical protein
LRTEREAIERAVQQFREIAGDGPPQPAATKSSPASPELNQQILGEYKFLRVELESIWTQNYSTLNFMLALIGLIITAAYGQKSEEIAGSPLRG